MPTEARPPHTAMPHTADAALRPPHRRIAASPHRRIAATPHRRAVRTATATAVAAKREEAIYSPHCTVGGINQLPPALGTPASRRLSQGRFARDPLPVVKGNCWRSGLGFLSCASEWPWRSGLPLISFAAEWRWSGIASLSFASEWRWSGIALPSFASGGR